MPTKQLDLFSNDFEPEQTVLPVKNSKQNIISASRRTDLPAFYSEWFMNRIREGSCEYRTPYQAPKEVSLLPEDVTTIVFWTRNAFPLLKHLDELDERGYKYYFLYTLNDAPKELEPYAPKMKPAVETFQELSERIAPAPVFWRYDPMVISDLTTPSYHEEKFEGLAEQLGNHTDRCYYSWLDIYNINKEKLNKLGLNIRSTYGKERHQLLTNLIKIAQANRIKLFACCEDDFQVHEEIEKAHCTDIEVIKQITKNEALGETLGKTRKKCGCAKSVDIGAYDLCVYGCLPCYATSSRQNAVRNKLRHDPKSKIII